MVYLDCSGITFCSRLDEKHLFAWALEIPGVVRWEQDTLVVRSRRVSQATLRELLALFFRYKIPMQQFARFENDRNAPWFTLPHAYWHNPVFGPHDSPHPPLDSRLPLTNDDR